MDKDCSLVVSYYYDAWGNIYPQYHSYVLTFAGETLTAEDVSNLNGLFYKGYYYDKENKLYYLITRYYDPEVGRFISPDDPQYLDFKTAYGHNRYAYCNNNPVMGYDPKGNIWISILVGALIGAATAFISTMVEDVQDDGEVNVSIGWRHYVGKILGSAIAGAGVGLASGLGLVAGAAWLTGSTSVSVSSFAIASVVSFGTGVIGYALRTGISDREKFDINNMLIEGLANTGKGMFAFGIGVFSGAMGFKSTVDDKITTGTKISNTISRSIIQFALKTFNEMMSDIFAQF